MENDKRIDVKLPCATPNIGAKINLPVAMERRNMGPIISSFSDMVNRLEKGQVAADLDKAMRQVIGAVSQSYEEGGKAAGGIVLKIGIRMKNGVIEVYSDHDVKLPKREGDGTVFYNTPENNLALTDPKQPGMFDNMRTIEATPEARVVGN